MTFLNFLEFSGLGVLTPARASGPHPPGVLRAQNGVDRGPIGPYGTGKRGAINYRKLNFAKCNISIDIIKLLRYNVITVREYLLRVYRQEVERNGLHDPS